MVLYIQLWYFVGLLHVSLYYCVIYHVCLIYVVGTYLLFISIPSGTRIKTRKRNIAAPLDPAAFSDAVVQIYLDNAGDLVMLRLHFAAFHLFNVCFASTLSLWFIHITDFVICACRNLLLRVLNLQTLTFQDTVTPFLRQAS